MPRIMQKVHITKQNEKFNNEPTNEKYETVSRNARSMDGERIMVGRRESTGKGPGQVVANAAPTKTTGKLQNSSNCGVPVQPKGTIHYKTKVVGNWSKGKWGGGRLGRNGNNVQEQYKGVGPFT